ncbi:MAG TPA: metallophosphoesterase [Polyangiaceae bacterium]|nr:metallophosphoesterase [Polyangiaceae bacterium]
MPILERPLVVVGDVHLSHGSRRDSGRALAELVRAHRGAEIMLNGDIFNLSLDAPERAPSDSVLAMLRAEPELREAVRAHLTGAGRLTVLPGNHDAALADPETRALLLGWLDLGEGAPLTCSRWFEKRGKIHVEHGHAYDPDNAPTHPLVRPSVTTEPLGVALTRRFLAPNRAFDFAHATEITPLEAIVRATRVFGARMPLLLARYLVTAGRFCRQAGWRPELAREREHGDILLRGAASELGLDVEILRALDDDRPRPTHESFERAFFRLYFDRIVATAGASAGVGLGALAKSRSLYGLAALSALYLLESQRRGRNRYEGLPVRRLRQASARVRDITGAELVIFGHTHVAEATAGYMNPGSFTYRAGEPRPYAFVGTNGGVERRFVTAS